MIADLRKQIAVSRSRVKSLSLAGPRESVEVLTDEFCILADCLDRVVQVVGDLVSMHGGEVCRRAVEEANQECRVTRPGPQDSSSRGMGNGKPAKPQAAGKQKKRQERAAKRVSRAK